MIIKKAIRILVLLLFLYPAGTRADLAMPADSSMIEIRLPDPQSIAEYKKQNEFQYKSGNGTFNILRLLPSWIRNAIVRFFEIVYNAGSAEIFLVILLVIAITAIILKANEINPITLFRKKTHNIQPAYTTGNAQIQDMNFQELIDQAADQRNYRLAVRYQYLQSLSKLAGTGEIELREGKTNRDYITEIKNPEIRRFFVTLVHGFEFTWYGEFLPDENQYSQLCSAFVTFNKLVQE